MDQSSPHRDLSLSSSMPMERFATSYMLCHANPHRDNYEEPKLQVSYEQQKIKLLGQTILKLTEEVTELKKVKKRRKMIAYFKVVLGLFGTVIFGSLIGAAFSMMTAPSDMSFWLGAGFLSILLGLLIVFANKLYTFFFKEKKDETQP
jgi:hypothetical protein